MTTFTLEQSNGVGAEAAAQLLFASSEELLRFMFRQQSVAIETVSNLFRLSKGHFSHRHARIALVEGNAIGIALGYGERELARETLRGSLNLMLYSSMHLWWHLMARVAPALDAYIPPPSRGSYYLNNLAVHPQQRGIGIGHRLLEDVIQRATADQFESVELDVTAKNERAISLYAAHGFDVIGAGNDEKLLERYGLPKLLRMRKPLTH